MALKHERHSEKRRAHFKRCLASTHSLVAYIYRAIFSCSCVCVWREGAFVYVPLTSIFWLRWVFISADVRSAVLYGCCRGRCRRYYCCWCCCCFSPSYVFSHRLCAYWSIFIYVFMYARTWKLCVSIPIPTHFLSFSCGTHSPRDNKSLVLLFLDEFVARAFASPSLYRFAFSKWKFLSIIRPLRRYIHSYILSPRTQLSISHIWCAFCRIWKSIFFSASSLSWRWLASFFVFERWLSSFVWCCCLTVKWISSIAVIRLV